MQYNSPSEEAYARLISHSMTVPQRIKATGEFGEDDHHANGQPGGGGWDYANEKFDMNVPDRILLLGQDQHMGTRATPREIQLDNAVLPSDPGTVRVNTPPRVITLDQHYFPSADDFPAGGAPASPPRSAPPRRAPDSRAFAPRMEFNDSTMTESRLALRDATPPGEGLTASEELLHLRRQLVKLNRRVMAIEADQLQRLQKEKIAYVVGVAYVLFKIIAWLNRT